MRLWDNPEALRGFSTGVSLHSHTRHSRESFGFFALLARNSWKNDAAGAQRELPAPYWTPPLTAEAAYQLERSQIEDGLDLAAIVSLTDHDNIEAPLLLSSKAAPVPISVEWTVPYRHIVLHFGVHNLPGHDAVALRGRMQAYSRDPSQPTLASLLAALSESPDTLVVLNHPLWRASRLFHRCSREDFLRRYRPFVHALEINASRTWEENQAVLELARAWSRPVVSGGDRHGREANAAVNLTRAGTMAEFVHEVRREGRSQVLLMPQYRKPLQLRILRTVLDAIQDYPAHPLGRYWDNRVFLPDRSGALRPLSALWDRPPLLVKATFSALPRLEENAVRWSRWLAGNTEPGSRPLPLPTGGQTA
jgi:hypothetical protein